MAKQITRWRPDTSDCIIDLEWDDTLPADERVFVAIKIENKPDHLSELSDSEAYQAILDENKSKNIAISEVKKNLAIDESEQLDWSIDSERKIHIKLPETITLTKAQKTESLQSLDTKLVKSEIVLE
jgi:hypothetical protein